MRFASPARPAAYDSTGAKHARSVAIGAAVGLLVIVVLFPPRGGAAKVSPVRVGVVCIPPSSESRVEAPRGEGAPCRPGDRVSFQVQLPRNAPHLRIWAPGPDGELDIRMPGASTAPFTWTDFEGGILGRGYRLRDDDPPGRYSFEFRFYRAARGLEPVIVSHRSVNLTVSEP